MLEEEKPSRAIISKKDVEGEDKGPAELGEGVERRRKERKEERRRSEEGERGITARN
jgi:hypothetical protein